MNVHCTIGSEVCNLSYRGRIGDIEDSQASIPIGKVGMGTNHLDTACLAGCVKVLHDRKSFWLGYIEDLEPLIPMRQIGIGA